MTTIPCPNCAHLVEYHPPKAITETKIVFPEGTAEQTLLDNLLSVRGIKGIQVLPSVGGNAKFQDALERYVISLHTKGDVECVILILDNNSDPPRHFENACRAMENAADFEYPTPSEPWKVEGSDGGRRGAILTIPAPNVNGATEGLIYPVLAQAFPEDHELVDKFHPATTVGQDAGLGDIKQEKARITALLTATCKNPPCLVHQMWQRNKNYDGESLLQDEVFDDMANFLGSL